MRLGLRTMVTATAIAMVTAACGGSNSNASGDAPSGSTSKHDIKIGAMLALSGEQAYANVPIVNAIKLAVDTINEQGGIDGRKVSVVTADSKGTPQDGVAAFNKLIGSDKVEALLGVSTPVIAATLPLAERNRKVLLDISTVGPKIWNETERKYAFSIYPKADVEMAAQADFAYDKLGARKAAVLAVDTETGQASADAFAKQFEKRGGSITRVARYPAAASDYRPQLQQVSAGNPEVISLIHNVEGGTVVRQGKELGIKARFLGYSGSVNDQFLKLAGAGADGMLASTVGWNPNDPHAAVQDFIKAYKAKFSQDPTVYSAMGYDGVQILARVIAQAGDQADDIAKSLFGFTYTGATGETKIGPKGLAAKEVFFKEVVGGAWSDVTGTSK